MLDSAGGEGPWFASRRTVDTAAEVTVQLVHAQSGVLEYARVLGQALSLFKRRRTTQGFACELKPFTNFFTESSFQLLPQALGMAVTPRPPSPIHLGAEGEAEVPVQMQHLGGAGRQPRVPWPYTSSWSLYIEQQREAAFFAAFPLPGAFSDTGEPLKLSDLHRNSSSYVRVWRCLLLRMSAQQGMWPCFHETPGPHPLGLHELLVQTLRA